MYKLLLPIFFLVSLTSCSLSRVQTIWKAEQALPYRTGTILVVAILPAGNDSLETILEKQTVKQLSLHGYNAVSYSDGFSIYAISQQTTQEAAYFTLCEKGIDAVLTLAKVEPGLSVPLKKGATVKYPASFYFNHIWNYRYLPLTTSSSGKPFVWECILFDLQSLEQRGVLQLKLPVGYKENNEPTWIVNSIIKKLTAEKIITNQTGKTLMQQKGF